MILGTTGLWIGPTRAQHEAFKRLVRRRPPDGFVHGGSSGWDVLAHKALTAEWPDIPVDIYPADGMISPAWNYIGWPGSDVIVHPATTMPERDRTIAKSIHWLVAIQGVGNSSPRSDALNEARENGLPIYIIRSDGRFMKDNDPVFA